MASTLFFGRVKNFASNLDISCFRKWAPLVALASRFFVCDQKTLVLKHSSEIVDYAAADGVSELKWHSKLFEEVRLTSSCTI